MDVYGETEEVCCEDNILSGMIFLSRYSGTDRTLLIRTTDWMLCICHHLVYIGNAQCLLCRVRIPAENCGSGQATPRWPSRESFIYRMKR